ncbi:hypothetical protein L249_3644 [Ophiocordyceps polyrhachis-furcata BCC 54312]|uniref:Histidinol-phosphatase n=1 Tax=Ophiocordyceps polyrhachis-furcata BCC 54312 TaxID=1330021 RepID=A0A367L4M8_9HYPO|nr:hypothetical protein L249_3644 [Ophiocordyceps polyrhachis-furcata BCC 54312]
MAFTMHSHSGQFCPGHAVDSLEAIVQHAISLGFETVGLTEHMPRYDERDLYPEEVPLFFSPLSPSLPSQHEKQSKQRGLRNPYPKAVKRTDDETAQTTLQALPPRHEAYLSEAMRLREKYESKVGILIGFEAEFIRPDYAPRVRDLASDRRVDYFIGSLHHVHGLPIDYDAGFYADAVAASSSSSSSSSGAGEEGLYRDYYDLQYEMLRALKPRVVGHFDLVRLLSADPGRDVSRLPAVWERIVRNLHLVASQGAWLECNTAALRKGLDEPYPCRVIAQKWLSMGGKFTISDDSHGVAQVATNYARGISYLESLGVESVWTLERRQNATLREKSVPLTEFRKHFP